MLVSDFVLPGTVTTVKETERKHESDSGAREERGQSASAYLMELAKSLDSLASF